MAKIESVFRTENKYLLADIERYGLQHYFSQVLREDPHNGSQGYIVRSLYFDTLDYRDYYEKLDGVSERRKLRLRIYGVDDPVAKLELKEKSGNYQRKRSLTLQREDAIAISNGDYSPLLLMDNSFANELYNLMKCYVYRPSCIVIYRRLAYIQPENRIRITFDSDVRANMSPHGLFEKNLVCCPVLSFGNTILEVKYDNFLFSYIKDVISSCDCMATAVSKYCMARNAGSLD